MIIFQKWATSYFSHVSRYQMIESNKIKKKKIFFTKAKRKKSVINIPNELQKQTKNVYGFMHFQSEMKYLVNENRIVNDWPIEESRHEWCITHHRRTKSPLGEISASTCTYVIYTIEWCHRRATEYRMNVWMNRCTWLFQNSFCFFIEVPICMYEFLPIDFHVCVCMRFFVCFLFLFLLLLMLSNGWVTGKSALFIRTDAVAAEKVCTYDFYWISVSVQFRFDDIHGRAYVFSTYIYILWFVWSWFVFLFLTIRNFIFTVLDAEFFFFLLYLFIPSTF